MNMFLGVLLIFTVSCFMTIRADDIEELRQEISEDYEESSKGNIFKRSIGHIRNYRFADLIGCKLCGLQFINSYDMLEGSEVTPTYKYPWMVALQHKKRKFCAGAIISDKFILTAAHCLVSNKTDTNGFLRPRDIKIGFLTRTNFVIVDNEVERVIPHLDFNLENVAHDIGLLKLKQKILCSKFRNPVCLPSIEIHIKEDQTFCVSGWDIKEAEYSGPHDTLRESTIKNVYFDNCVQWYYKAELRKQYYCVENADDNKNCHGDSGSPMFRRHGQKYYVAGVASVFASDKCKLGEPFIYTSVEAHMEWIMEILEPVMGNRLSTGWRKKCRKRGRKYIKH